MASFANPTGVVASRPLSGAMAALALAILLPSLATSIANAALPVLVGAMNAGFQSAQWIILAYLLALTTLVVAAGRLGDMFGRRRLLLAGIATFTSASLLCALSPNLALLLAARAMQGAGAAMMLALGMTLVGGVVPESRMGSAMGMLGSMSALGTTLGPAAGGVLTSLFGWQSIFLIQLPLGAVAFLLAARTLPADRDATQGQSQTFDVAGLILLTAALAAFALAMTYDRGRLGPTTIALMSAAFVITLIFVMVESRAADPLLPLPIFRVRGIGAALGLNILVSTVMMTTLVVGPFYLAFSLQLGAVASGVVLAIGPMVAALTGIPGGRLVDRFGAEQMAMAGLTTMVAACMALGIIPGSMVPPSYGVAAYILPIVLLTSGYATFQAANNSAIMRDAPARERGLVSGMITLSRNLGLVTGGSAMAALFAWAAGTGQMANASHEAIANGLRVSFLCAGTLLMGALLLVLICRPSAE